MVKSLEYTAWWTEGYLKSWTIRSNDLESVEIEKCDQVEKSSEDNEVRGDTMNTKMLNYLLCAYDELKKKKTRVESMFTCRRYNMFFEVSTQPDLEIGYRMYACRLLYIFKGCL